MGCVLVLAIFTSSIAFSGCNLNDNSQGQSQQQGQPNEDLGGSGQSNSGGGSSEIEQSKEDEVTFSFTVDASKLHTNLQLAYLTDSYSNISKYATGMQELSKPQPIRFRWQSSQSATNCELNISENEDLSNGKTISVKTKEIKISNLKVHTKYYYQMTAIVGGKTVMSAVESFSTGSFLPRLIDCDGVTNMRDLGGYNVEEGVVKQGLVYRSGRLNASYTTTYREDITEKGKETMKELGIKSEIDLRTSANNDNELGGLQNATVGPLGKDVNYYQAPMNYHNGTNHKENYASIRKVFSYLADEENYPMIIHCNIGTDRTGFISYMLNGLLGVSQEYLFRDYLFSNFGYIEGSRSLSKISGYVNEIDECEGEVLSEKVENYLTDTIGVPQADIDAIRDILIEEHTYTDTVVTEGTCVQQAYVKRTCNDNDLLSYYTYGEYGDHKFSESNGEVLARCSYCDEVKFVGALPTGYTAIEYIESFGTQYIDTGFCPNSNTRVVTKIDFKNSTSATSQNAFSARGARGNSQEYGFLVSEGSYVSRYGDDIYFDYGYEGKPFIVDQNKNVLFINNKLIKTHEEKEFSCDVSMAIFASNRDGSVSRYASMKLYYMTIYDNGNLVRYFVPCVNSQGVIGLYDVVGNQFYTNQGTGTFINGNVLA